MEARDQQKTTAAPVTGQNRLVAGDKRAVRILAKSIYRELTSQGYDDRQIVSLATELLSEVTERISADSSQ